MPASGVDDSQRPARFLDRTVSTGLPPPDRAQSGVAGHVGQVRRPLLEQVSGGQVATAFLIDPDAAHVGNLTAH